MSVLQNKKLRVWSSAPTTVVFVIQDGTTTDPLATYQWDDGFRSGSSPGDETNSGDQVDKFYIRLDYLENDYDNGHRFGFTVLGRHAWWSMNDSGGFRAMPGDLVEFMADRGDQADTVLGTIESWTLHEQATGQRRYFYGWVTSTTPNSNGEVTVECHSGLVEADKKVRMERHADAGLSIPKIAFNLVDPTNPDYAYSIKKVDNTGSTVLQIAGAGIPIDHTDQQLTLEEILQYLEAEYAPALNAANITASSSAAFVAADLVDLTMKPQPMVLQDVGFTECVKQLLRWAPNVRLMFDPRNLIFRIAEIEPGFTTTSTTLILGEPAGETELRVGNVDIFSATPGDDGYRIKVGSYANMEECIVTAVNSPAGHITISTGLALTHAATSVVQPIKGAALATVTADYDADIRQDALSLRADLDGSYSSVRIQSINQETGTYRGSLSDGTLLRGWNTAFDSAWRPGDEHRESDFGNGPNDGIPIYSIETGASGGSGGNDVFYISYVDSAFHEDHVDDEWAGCSLWVMSADNTNVKNSAYAYEIVSSTEVTDIGNGEKGLAIEVNKENVTAAVGGTLHTEVLGTGSDGVADVIAIVGDFQFPTTQNINERSAVGRMWYFSDPVVAQQSESPHVTTCNLPKIYVSDGSANGRRQVAQASGMGYPGLNQGPVSQWNQIAGGPSGAFQVYTKSFHTESPVFDKSNAGCAQGIGLANGYTLPKGMIAIQEYTTTTIREARIPASGEAGLANLTHNVSQTKELSSEEWNRSDQDAHYTTLAERLFDVYQNPHYTGSATFIGTVEHGYLLDLMVRMAFTTQMGVAGGGDILRKFWGLVQRARLDLNTDEVEVEFDNRSAFADIAFQVIEDWGIDHKAKLKAQIAQVKAMATLPACLAGMSHIVNVSAPASVCGGAVALGPRPLPRIIAQIPIKEQGFGIGDTSIAIPEPVAGPKFSTYTTHGTKAYAGVERGLDGALWYVSELGTYPVTANTTGEEGTVNTGSATYYPETIPQQNANAIQNIMAAITGLTPVVSAPPALSHITASSNGTDTVFTISHTALPDATGGEIHVLDYDENNPRPGYAITGHSGANVTVGLIAEDLPPNGAPCTIYYVGAPTLNAADFPSGGVPLQDSNSDYLVFDYATYSLVAATLTGNELGAQSGTGNTRVVKFGPDTDTNLSIDWGVDASDGFLKDIPRDNVTAGSATTNATTSDDTFVHNTSITSHTLNLYACSGNVGRTVKVIKTDSSANTVTITRAGSDTIEGSTTLVLTHQWDFAVLTVIDSNTWGSFGQNIGGGK